MPDRVAIERGFAFETRLGDLLGGDLRPGSGNQWDSRGDVSAGVFLFQAKATSKRTWAETRRELREAIDDAQGTGRLPGLAVLDEDGEELVVLRLSELIEALASGVTLERQETGGERRRKIASMPALLRDDG